MNKRKIVATLMGFALITALSACGANTPTNNDDTSSNPPIVQPSDEQIDDDTSNEAVLITSYKTSASSKLDELVNPIIAKIADADLKAAVQQYYDTEKVYINGITDLDTAKEATTKVIDDTKAFAKNTLKPLAINKLNSAVEPMIAKITHEELKKSVQTFYTSEMAKIENVETLSDVSDTYSTILDDTKDFIATETVKIVVALKNKALEELDPFVVALIDKIPYESLKTDTQTFYAQEKAKLEAVDTIEGVTPCITEIKNDLEAYALTQTKNYAVSKLEEVVNAGLEKIPNEQLKTSLTTFSTTEIAKLNAVTKMEDVPNALASVITETEAYIKDLLINTVKTYLSQLTAVETATAYDYLPTAMSPTYANNAVSASAINYDFTSSTNVSDINKAGFGEQWQMIVENINESIAMAKIFNVAQTVFSSAGSAVEIYITNSYADEMSYTFSGTNYNGKFEFKNQKLVFDVTMTSQITLPVFGSVCPVVKMEYDLQNNAKAMFISLGDAYKVKYVLSDTSYEMATTYGLTLSGKSASRSSYLSISQTNAKTTGHIYEYTTYENSDKSTDLIKACADFYIENGFVSVVGNKSSGMIGFKGYINELYLANAGRLLGYEVREELTFYGVTGTYNTLWFNLWDIQGINSVKVTKKTSANKSEKSTVDVYLNGSTTLLSPTYNTKVVKTSRKYDVELRNRYYYTYDAENNEYVANEVQVPMMFIQEGENFNSFVSDIKKDNDITASVALSTTYLNKILDDYDTLIDIFIANKDAMSSETIVAYLKKYE